MIQYEAGGIDELGYVSDEWQRSGDEGPHQEPCMIHSRFSLACWRAGDGCQVDGHGAPQVDRSLRARIGRTLRRAVNVPCARGIAATLRDLPGTLRSVIRE